MSQQRRLWTALAPALLTNRPNWPQDVPVRVGPLIEEGWFYGEHDRRLITSFSVPAPLLSRHIVGAVDHGQDEDPPKSDLWNDGTIDLGLHPPGTTITATYRVVENGRTIWETAAPAVTIAGAIADHLTPVPANVDQAISVEVSRDTIYVMIEGTSLKRAIGHIAFAAVVEVCHHEQPVAIARFWTDFHRGSFCFSSLDGDFLPLTGDLSALLASPDDDPSWTIRFRGDPETALRDPTATHYWSGELTLTRAQFTVTP